MLNGCEKVLQLHRYNQRYDWVLAVIKQLILEYIPETHQLTADLDDSYQFPTDFAATSLWPDIVVWSQGRRELYLVELTICYETWFAETAERKQSKYLELMDEATSGGFKTKLVTIQVGSRGGLDEGGLRKLRYVLQPIPTKRWKKFLLHVTKSVIQESHQIWCNRNRIIQSVIQVDSREGHHDLCSQFREWLGKIGPFPDVPPSSLFVLIYACNSRRFYYY